MVKYEKHIPEDLALSVLSKLPLKSLKRFGCVNKTWSLLFQNPNFIKLYRTDFISNDHRHSYYYDDTSIFLHQELLSVSFPNGNLTCKTYCHLHSLSGQRFGNRFKLNMPTPFHEEDSRFYILGCGHFIGLLCLCLHNRSLVLWNPTTDQSHVIPPSSIESTSNIQGLVCLSGFGYDHVRDDYKIIRHIGFSKLKKVFEIYSLRFNSWKELDVNMPNCRWESERLYLDGICHWWSEIYSDNYDDQYTEEDYLVSFDLTNDEVFTTLVPLSILLDLDANFDMDLVSKHLVVLNGSVALILWCVGSAVSFNDETTFHIFILGELGVTESWTKLFIVGPLPYIDHPIGAGKNGDIFFRSNSNELVCFNLSTQIIEGLGLKEVCSYSIVLCKKILVSIGAINH